MNYTITEQFNKRFIIDLGLRPGYEQNAKSFTIEDVKQWYADWQQKRAKTNEPYFAGIITATNFVYVHKENKTTKSEHEPSVRIEGEITKEYHGHIFNDEEKTLEIIFDLASHLGTQGKQERIHIMFNQKFFVLQNKIS